MRRKLLSCFASEKKFFCFYYRSIVGELNHSVCKLNKKFNNILCWLLNVNNSDSLGDELMVSLSIFGTQRRGKIVKLLLKWICLVDRMQTISIWVSFDEVSLTNLWVFDEFLSFSIHPTILPYQWFGEYNLTFFF